MVIDFRIRPPFKSFLELGIIKTWQSAGNIADPRLQKPTGFERQPVPSVDEGSIDLMIKEMDEAGVTHGVIMGRQTHNPVYGDTLHSDVYELTEKYPGRFSGFVGICPHSPTAVEEIEDCVKKYHIKGVSVDGGWCNPPIYFDDPSMVPIFDACQQYNLILTLTMSSFLGPDLTYSDPTRLMPILKKFNKVKVVFAHGCWPKVAEVLGVAMQCPNVYVSPDCYVYVREMPMFQEYARAANSWLKYRFLFATSYPIRGFKQSIENWKNRGLEKEALERSLYYNAAELLQLI